MRKIEEFFLEHKNLKLSGVWISNSNLDLYFSDSGYEVTQYVELFPAIKIKIIPDARENFPSQLAFNSFCLGSLFGNDLAVTFKDEALILETKSHSNRSVCLKIGSKSQPYFEFSKVKDIIYQNSKPRSGNLESLSPLQYVERLRGMRLKKVGFFLSPITLIFSDCENLSLELIVNSEMTFSGGSSDLIMNFPSLRNLFQTAQEMSCIADCVETRLIEVLVENTGKLRLSFENGVTLTLFEKHPNDEYIEELWSLNDYDTKEILAEYWEGKGLI